jgi:hypothetical protein
VQRPASPLVGAAGALAAIALAATASAEQPDAPAPVPASTQVHIVTEKAGVMLEWRAAPPLLPGGSRPGGEPQWVPLCLAPCDALLPLGGEYRLSGEAITRSGPFALHGPRIDLHVAAGSYALRRAGVLLTFLGLLGATAAGIFLAVDSVHPAEKPGGGLGTAGRVSAGVLAGSGAVGLVGVGLILGSGTSVRDETQKALAYAGPPAFRF